MRASFQGIALCTILALASCNGEKYTPLPVGYFRIDLPPHTYSEKLTPCHVKLQVPALSRLEFYPPKEGAEGCWFDIYYPSLKSRIHLTYKPVKDNLREYLEESRMLAYEHQIKASRITSQIVKRPESKVYGLAYELDGNVASWYQFYLTDSVSHFLRGSLYFEARPNSDSITPVLEYVKQDLAHLLTTLEWSAQ